MHDNILIKEKNWTRRSLFDDACKYKIPQQTEKRKKNKQNLEKKRSACPFCKITKKNESSILFFCYFIMCLLVSVLSYSSVVCTCKRNERIIIKKPTCVFAKET
jgi:hypothetical protein